MVYAVSLSQRRAVEFRPGGKQCAAIWDKFYAGDHEPELDDPLIGAGKSMTLAICEAIRNRDMKYRRYAIGALGYIADRRALPVLDSLLANQSELEYFRSDALHAIYQIDDSLGTTYAARFSNLKNTLGLIARAILKREAWLKEPTEEQ
jgi:hypothetical protein